MPQSPKAPFRITPVVFHVMLSLADQETHAYRIMKDVDERTRGSIKIGPGSLHFTLAKLLEAGMIEESAHRPDPAMDDSRRKYYRLTDFGREFLSAEATKLADIVEIARGMDLISGAGGR